jgi:hypothetical protein
VSCLAFFASRTAFAQTPTASSPESAPPFRVAVERDDAAVSCPDVVWFEERIASHAGQAGYAGTFKVSLSRRGAAWYARIQRWEKNRAAPAAERVLQDRSVACKPLAEAVALTVAILADDYAQRAEPRPAAVVEARPEARPRVAPPLSRTTASASKVWVGAGGGAAVSFIAPVAPILGFSVALDSASLRQRLRVMLSTEHKFELAPGRVVVQAWLVSALSCARFSRGSFGAGLCGAFDAAMLRASAEGFDNGKPSTERYAAIGLEAQPSWDISPSYRMSAALAALVPFTRESFSVTGRGVAYVPPPLNWRILVFSEIGAF